MPSTDTRPPRPGDTIQDPSGARNRVLQATNTKLLLVDPYGFQFILGKHRLHHGWTHKAPEPSKRTKPRQLAELRYAPSPRRRIHARD